MERRLAAILLTDMVGYSRLMGLDEEGTIARQKAHRQEIVDPKIAEFGGRIVKSTGDGLLVEFPSVVQAVRCAVEVQSTMQDRDSDQPNDRRIFYRVGVNLGDIVADGDDILGDGVNIAARLEALADPGGICISGAAYDQLAGKLEVSFEYDGEHRVKNVPRPVKVWRWNSEQPAREHENEVVASHTAAECQESYESEQPSIAVLPFTNLSSDPEQDFFGDGICEEIINTLSKISKMRVIARHSTFAFKGKTIDVRAIARDLGVRHVVEGGVRCFGKRLRVTAQLIDSRDGSQLWADRFDRQVEDLFDIQDEITKEVVTALQVNLTVGEEARVWSRGTSNVEAWQYCVRAIEHQHRLTPTHHLEARRLAERAIELDPNYAYAWGVLGFSYFREARLDVSGDRNERLQRVAEIAEKAIELDATVSWGVALRAMAAAGLGEYEKAVVTATQAMEMQPGNADTRAYAALVYAFDGRFEEAVEQVSTALSLNPYPPVWYRTALVRSLALSGASDKAIEVGQDMLLAEPDHFPARFFLTYALQVDGRDREAQASASALRRLVPHFTTQHVPGYLTMRDQRLVDHVTEVMRQAGLPDSQNLPRPDRPSVAVLPFKSLSADPEHEFLADGIADDVITGLSKFKSVFVIARSSSFAFKEQKTDVRTIASELGVRYVVEGTLRVAGERIRVTGQLIEAETGAQIWAHRFDGSLDDLFAVQDEITNAIVLAIEPEIGRSERERARRTPPDSIDAWAQYQRGLSSYFGTTESRLLEALSTFDRLCELDPAFAPGFAMAADTRTRLVVHYQSERAEELLSIAERKAARALELEPHDALGYWADGRVKCMQRRYDEAIPQLEKAINLNPNYAMAYHALGYTLAHIGRSEEAIAQQDMAIRISPNDAFMGGFLALKGEALLQLGRFDEALATAQRALGSPNPRYWVHALIAIASAELGREDESRRAAAELTRLKPDIMEHLERVGQKGMNIYAELLSKHRLVEPDT